MILCVYVDSTIGNYSTSGKNGNKKEAGASILLWYARQDLNLRPFAPQANALSS